MSVAVVRLTRERALYGTLDPHIAWVDDHICQLQSGEVVLILSLRHTRARHHDSIPDAELTRWSYCFVAGMGFGWIGDSPHDISWEFLDESS